jgi:hypothetical protein
MANASGPDISGPPAFGPDTFTTIDTANVVALEEQVRTQTVFLIASWTIAGILLILNLVFLALCLAYRSDAKHTRHFRLKDRDCRRLIHAA